ncbi:MAG: porin [Caldimonas sp.]
MKKSLLALAVLGAFAGVASAQSSVTLYGTIDLSGKYVKNDGTTKRLSLSQDGINSSQLGFRGVEDLGGGLKATFVLLAGVNADTGTSNSKFFNRKATVSLLNNAGELRLGRDYTPSFWNNTIYDAFGTNGLGSSINAVQLPTGTLVRADNSIGYFLPSNIGGFYGQLMLAAGEGATPVPGLLASATAPANGSPVGSPYSGSANPGRYIGGRIGFAAGPFDIAGAYATQRYIYTTGRNAAGASQKTYNIGGSYDFGFLKILGYIDRDKVDFAKETRGSISTVIPFGQSEIHLGYSRSKLTVDGVAGFSNTVWQAAATYQYNLSKRTAMYGTISQLTNGDHSAFSVSSGTALRAAPTAGGDSKGFEVGLRHFF